VSDAHERPAVGDPAPAPPAPRSEADVVARWRDGQPVVSVLCPTYQHVGFIEDALRGFLGQDTDFPFEVLVRDDASTDGTAEVVADYAARYPTVVRAVLEPTNRYAEIGASRVLVPMARGSFLAWCEGDDYWVDPDKLAIQVATLQERPDAAASFHDAVIIMDGRVMTPSQLGPDGRRDRPAAELRRSKALPLRTMVVRNVPTLASTGIPHGRRVWNGDRFLTIRTGTVGDAAYDGSVGPAVYRKHPGGVSTTLREDALARAHVKAASAYWIGTWLAEAGYPDDAAHHLARGARILVRSHEEQGIDPREELSRQLGKRGVLERLGQRLARPVAAFARAGSRR
jgi:glycosyltransferase involved in cell wall biosynthesis